MEYPAISSPPQPPRRLLYAGFDLKPLKPLREALKPEGWLVVRCPDGNTARLLLRSRIHYDLLLFDDELPGACGLELVRFARSLERRERTPIILLSLKDCAIEAQRAGANCVIRKPEHIPALAKAVRRLLASSGG